jgi:adenosylhomocysteine nucleosidase
MKKINKLGLMSALPQEQANMREMLSNVSASHFAKREFIAGQFRIEDHAIHIVCALSGIGKVAAATTASTLITHYGCDALLFTGVAGGIGKGVKVGDVVIGTQCLQHDMDASPLFPRYELPMRGVSVLPTDLALTRVLRKAVLASMAAQSTTITTVHEGLIVSGDKFMSAAHESRTLRDGLQAAGYAPLCVEMEGAAVAQVCDDFKLPFALARIISDRADDDAHIDFTQFLNTIAAPLSHGIITQFLTLLNC